MVPGCLVPVPQIIKIEEDCLRWEKAMTTHSSTLAGKSRGWRSWWTAVYGVAQSWAQLKRLSRSSSPR